MAGTSDRPVVNTDENFYLRRYVKARDSGDVDGQREAWGLLLSVTSDRVKMLVRVSARGKLFNETEIEDAIGEAYIRLSRRMWETFEGTIIGQYVNMLKQLCEYSVLDVQRKNANRSKHEAGSMDTGSDDGGGGEIAPFSGALRGEADRRAALIEDHLEAATLLARYLPKLKKQRSRTVLEHMRDGVPLEETAKQLKISDDNAYQLRSRALKEMRRLIEEDQS